MSRVRKYYHLLAYLHCGNGGKPTHCRDCCIQPNLGFPYVLLYYLSFMDAVYSTTVTPNTCIYLLYEKKTIYFQAYMAQLFTEHLFGCAEIILLVVMACDCYVAICKPLHYLTIMNQQVCVLLLLLVWIGGFYML